MIHFEDLFAAMRTYNMRFARIRTTSIRQPLRWEEEIAAALAEFKAVCDKAGLPIDWTPR